MSRSHAPAFFLMKSDFRNYKTDEMLKPCCQTELNRCPPCTCRAPGARGCRSRPPPAGPPGEWPPSPGQVPGVRYPGTQVPARCSWRSTSPACALPTGLLGRTGQATTVQGLTRLPQPSTTKESSLQCSLLQVMWTYPA